MKHIQRQVPRFQAGDIVFFSGQGDLYSRVSRWLMRSPNEGPTFAVHTAQLLNSRSVLELDYVGRVKTVDDIMNRRVKVDTWKRRGFEVWRCRTLRERDRQALTRQALHYLHVRFGMAKLFAHLFDGLISRVAHRDIYFFRRGDNDYPVCSEITSMTYYKALGYRFGVPPDCADPDHVHDWVVSHPDEWERVYSLEEYPEVVQPTVAAGA